VTPSQNAENVMSHHEYCDTRDPIIRTKPCNCPPGWPRAGAASYGKCQSILRMTLAACGKPAKWITPNNGHHAGGWKVCGYHRARYETAIHKCEAIK
jgi:hypothetical protein